MSPDSTMPGEIATFEKRGKALPGEISPPGYPEWRRFDEWGQQGRQLEFVRTLVYHNPGGQRKDNDRPIVKDPNGILWIGNPSKSDEQIKQSYDRSIQSGANPEYIDGLTAEDKKQRDKYEQVQYIAWKLAVLLDLQGYELPEVRAGMFEGKRYVWSRFVENVAKGGSADSYLHPYSDYSERERALKNLVFAALTKNDPNALNYLRTTDGKIIDIDFEGATGRELRTNWLTVSPYDSGEVYLEEAQKIKKMTADTWETFVPAVKQILVESGYQDKRKIGDLLSNFLDADTVCLRTLQKVQDEVRNAVRNEFRESLAVLAYEELASAFYPGGHLKHVFDSSNPLDIELMVKLQELMTQPPGKARNTDAFNMLTQNGKLVKKGSDYFIPALNDINNMDLYIQLSLLKPLTNFAEESP